MPAQELTRAIARLESADPCLIMIGRAIDTRRATGSLHGLPRNQLVNLEPEIVLPEPIRARADRIDYNLAAIPAEFEAARIELPAATEGADPR